MRIRFPWLMVIFTLFLAPLALPGQAGQIDQPPQTSQTGQGAQTSQAGQTDSVREMLVLAEELFLETQQQRLFLGRQQQLENYDRVYSLAEEALRVDPASADAWYWLAASAGARGEVRGLLASAFELETVLGGLNRCLELDGNHFDGWITLARVHNALPALFGGDRQLAVDAAYRAARLLLWSLRSQEPGRPGQQESASPEQELGEEAAGPGMPVLSAAEAHFLARFSEGADALGVLIHALWNRNRGHDRNLAQGFLTPLLSGNGAYTAGRLRDRIAADVKEALNNR